MLEIFYIIVALVIVAGLGIPYVIERGKYKKMLREIEKEEERE